MSDQLQRYALEHQISPVQYQVALMYFRDHELARQYLRRASPEHRPGAERFRRAAYALGSHRLIVTAVVVDNAGASSWSFEHGQRRDEGMAQLRAGLSALVSFYANIEVEA